MNTDLIKKLGIALLIAVVAGASFALYQVLPRHTGDAQRYAELHRLGSSYERAWTGHPRLSELMAALVHFSSPSNYYRARFDTQRQALMGSGYLLEVTVPVPDLRSKSTQVRVSLSNTVQQTGAYYEAKLDDSKDEVRLVCRQEDVSLWQKTLRSYSRWARRRRHPHRPSGTQRLHLSQFAVFYSAVQKQQGFI
jgi:hypothetical protein